MPRKYCLSYLTLELPPPETLEIARSAGYQFAGIRMMPTMPDGACYPLYNDPQLLRETLLRIEATGVAVLDVEIARIDGKTSVEHWLPMLEAAGRIGARTIIAAGDDPDFNRMTDTFAALCDAAEEFYLSINLECTPWSTLSDIRKATEVVAAADRDNGEVLVDTIHVARSNSTLQDLAAIDARRLSYFQICDAPAGIPSSRDELLFTARVERLLPGEGGVNLEEQIAMLPKDLIVSVEIPSHARRASMGPLAWASEALRSSKAFMEQFDAAHWGQQGTTPR